MIYVLMLVIAVAFGGFVWQLYSAPDIPRIAAQPGPYKVQPPPDATNAPDEIEQDALGAGGETAPAAAPAATVVDAADETAPPAVAAAPQVAGAPRFVSNGPYVAQ